jgi:hypothetical protein
MNSTSPGLKGGTYSYGSIKGIGIRASQWRRSGLAHRRHRNSGWGAATILVQMVALNFAITDLANNDQFNQDETSQGYRGDAQLKRDHC